MKAKWIKNKFNSERGSVLLWTMMFIALFFLTVSTVAVITILEIRQSSKIDSSTEAYLLAEAGSERAKNYVASEKITEGGEKSGIIDGNTYTFKVVHATGSDIPNYDGTRPCVALDTDGLPGISTSDSNYCYYSQATVGNIRRKIDGEKKDISLEQGKNADFYSPSFALSATDIAGTQSFNFNTVPDTSIPFNPPVDPKVFINNIFVNLYSAGPSDIFYFGLASGFNSGIAIKIQGENFSIVDMTGRNTATENVLASLNNVTVPADKNIRLELIYRKNSAATLKITDSSGECLGVISTSSNMAAINPYYAFFDIASYSQSKIWLTYENEIFITGSFLRVE